MLSRIISISFSYLPSLSYYLIYPIIIYSLIFTSNIVTHSYYHAISSISIEISSYILIVMSSNITFSISLPLFYSITYCEILSCLIMLMLSHSYNSAIASLFSSLYAYLMPIFYYQSFIILYCIQISYAYELY